MRAPRIFVFCFYDRRPTPHSGGFHRVGVYTDPVLVAGAVRDGQRGTGQRTGSRRPTIRIHDPTEQPAACATPMPRPVPVGFGHPPRDPPNRVSHPTGRCSVARFRPRHPAPHPVGQHGRHTRRRLPTRHGRLNVGGVPAGHGHTPIGRRNRPCSEPAGRKVSRTRRNQRPACPAAASDVLRSRTQPPFHGVVGPRYPFQAKGQGAADDLFTAFPKRISATTNALRGRPFLSNHAGVIVGRIGRGSTRPAYPRWSPRTPQIRCQHWCLCYHNTPIITNYNLCWSMSMLY